MKNKIKYLINILKLLIYPLFFTLFELLLLSLISLKYQKLGYEYNTTTNSYVYGLSDYINSKTWIVILITFIFFVPIIYYIFKKNKFNTCVKLEHKKVLLITLLGISICLIYNIFIFYLNNIFNFTNQYNEVNNMVLISIISSGILGPIIEELIFRGIIYNKLKEFNNKKISLIICSIIFALFHSSIIEIIYSFFVGCILISIYEKYKTLKYPIILHISLNLTITILYNIIILDNIIFNLYLVFVSIIILTIINKIIKS